MHTKIPATIVNRAALAMALALLAVSAGAGQIALPANGAAASMPAMTAPDPATQGRIRNTLGKLPLYFEANHGQTDEEVKFLSRTGGYTLFLTPTEAVLMLAARKDPARTTFSTPSPLAGEGRGEGETLDNPAAVLRLRWLHANPDPTIRGAEPQPGKSSYFIGNDSAKWRSNVAHYAKVHYEAVYPGIDLVYYGNQSKIEYDFVVQPGADPNHIRLAIDGAQNIRLDADGNLILATTHGELLQQAPVIYQDIKGKRVPVEGQYVLHANKEVGFQVAAYDPEQTLVIDPILQSTYLGGSGNDIAYETIAVHPTTGDVYVAGETASSNFPAIASGADTTFTGTSEAFVARFNSALTSLIQATFLGGSGVDAAYALAIHPVTGDVYVAGETASSNFPAIASGADTTFTGTSEAFVARFNSTLTSLTQSTFLGGSSNFEVAYVIAIHPVSGEVYVAGYTNSSDFPGIAGGADTTFAGAEEAFVARLNSTLTSLTQSTFLGGSGNFDVVFAIAIHPVGGDVYVAGYTDSSNFPGIAGGADTTFAGAEEAFVARLNSALTSLTQATFLGGSAGGSAQEIAHAIAIHPITGDVYVAGMTSSSDFPGVAGGADTTFVGAGEGFVVRHPSTLTALNQTTFLGGSGDERVISISIHPATGDVYVSGDTSSPDFPGVAGGADTTFVGAGEGFVVRLPSTLTALTQATFLGGGGLDIAHGLVIHPLSGEIYVTGVSDSTDFPSTTSGAQPANGGTQDAFITRLTANLSTAPQAMFIADFNNGTLPSQLRVSTSPLTLTSMTQNVSGGVLNVSAVGALQNEQLRVGTCFKAVGDFVATVDAIRTVATGQVVQGVGWTNPTRFGYTQYNGASLIQGYAGISGGASAISNTASSTQFRVERVGNTTTSSVDTGAGFTTLQSATDVSLAATNDFGLYLLVENTATGGNQTGSFDNLAITASQFEPGLTAAAVTSTITAGSTAVINTSLCGVNPTGTVTVREGAIVLTTQALTNGAAAFNVTGLAVGAHSLIVEYAGDAIHTTVVSAPIVITVTPAGAPQADLVVITTASPNPASVNGTLTYTAQVTNNGSSSATGVTLASTLTGSSFNFGSISPSQGSCTGTTTATCNLGTLANGASATVTISVTPIVAGTIALNVSAAATEADPNATNNSATATVSVVQTICSNSLQGFASNLFGAQAANCSVSVGPSAAGGGGGGGSFDPFLLVGLALLYLGRYRRRSWLAAGNAG